MTCAFRELEEGIQFESCYKNNVSHHSICITRILRTLFGSLTDDLVFCLDVLDLGQINHLAKICGNATHGKEERDAQTEPQNPVAREDRHDDAVGWCKCGD